MDAGTFAFALERLEFSPYLARLIAFTAAATFTWILNRRYTFADRRSADGQPSWALRACQSSSRLRQSGCIWSYSVADRPRMAMALHCLGHGRRCGLALNFLLYDRIVFPCCPQSVIGVRHHTKSLEDDKNSTSENLNEVAVLAR